MKDKERGRGSCLGPCGGRWQALFGPALPPGATSGPNPRWKPSHLSCSGGVWPQVPLDWEPQGRALFLLVFEARALFRAWEYSRCPIKVYSVELCAQHTLSVPSSSRQPWPLVCKLWGGGLVMGGGGGWRRSLVESWELLGGRPIGLGYPRRGPSTLALQKVPGLRFLTPERPPGTRRRRWRRRLQSVPIT